MENNRPALGPVPTPSRRRPASRAQQQVLDALAAEDRPAPLTRLSATTGLHENTLRAHLDALAHAGLVRRTRAEPHGRGRPAWLWRPAPAAPRAGEYAGLAATLARTLHRTSAHPADDAIAAGREWGRDLVADRPTDRDAADPAAQGLDPRAEVNDLLDDLGFAPVPKPGADEPMTVRLTGCPLLDVAREHPDIVCNVHLGLVGGALERLGGEDIDATLVPFAEPGACLLHLTAPAEPPSTGR